MVARVLPSFWRTDDPTLDARGLVVKGGMWRHQREWWELKNFIRILVGGYGSGKTIELCKRMISLALINAPVPVAIVSPTFPMARQTTIRTLVELLKGKETLIKGFTWKHNKSTFEFEIRHGGRTGTILIYSGDHPERLKGPNLSAAGIDEPFLQDEEVFTQMVARVRHPDSKRIEINLTGTPEQLNWGYDLAEGELNDRHDVGVVRGSTRDNRALDTEYTKRLEGSFDDKAQAAYIDGEFVNLAAGLVFHAFDPTKHIIKRQIPDSAALWLGMDFNVNPMAFVVGYETGDGLHILRDYEIPNSDTQDACRVALSDFPKLGEVFPDPSCRQRSTSSPGGKTDEHYLREAGLHVSAPTAPWPLRDSFNAVNGAFRNGKLTISPECKRLKKYLCTFSHELMPRQESMKHLLDAMRYPVTSMFPVARATATSEVFFG